MHMSVIGVGKAYVLKKGRRAGQKVTVTKVLDGRYVLVKGEKGKERKSSVAHILPLEHKK